MDAGPAAAFYKQPGKGMQYDLGERTMQDLITADTCDSCLERGKNDAPIQEF
ncbi:MAG: hypothetical protein ACHQK9_05020 [Reyranellales bacterium]